MIILFRHKAIPQFVSIPRIIPVQSLNSFLLFTVSDGVLRRLSICRTIWPHMLAMALTYMVTLSLYPGVETLLTSCSLGAWTSLVLMSVFNVTDLLGKMTASMSSIQALSSVVLVLVPLARIILVPLTLLAATR